VVFKFIDLGCASRIAVVVEIARRLSEKCWALGFGFLTTDYADYTDLKKEMKS
jgi:hypothetical protein